MKRTTSIIFMVLILATAINIANAQGYGHCSYGNFPYGNCVITPTPSASEGVGGSSGSINIPSIFTEVDLFGTQPDFINNQAVCKKGYQLYDERCYPCDSSIGYLKFNPEDRSMLCVECPKGFELINGSCTSKKPIDKIKGGINKYALNISGFFKTTNINTGYFILVISGVLVASYYLQKKKMKKIKTEESSEEDNDFYG